MSRLTARRSSSGFRREITVPSGATMRAIAVAVALQNQPGTGGETAAPIAKDIMAAYLRRGSD